MMILVAALGKPIVLLLLKDKWLPSVPYIVVFCIGLMLRPVNTCNLQGVKAVGASRTYFWIEVVKKIVGLTIMIITMIVFKTPYAVAVGYTVTCFFSLIINSMPNKKLLNYSLIEQLTDLFPIAICSFITGIVVFFLVDMIQSDFLQIIIGGCIGVVIYVIMCKVLKIEELQEAFRLLFKLLNRRELEK